MSLQIIEIYKSIQGESSLVGQPCTFIRLAGCPLRCRWCDTVYGFKNGETREESSIIEEVLSHDIPFVELTGGEPLAQDCIPLMRSLIQRNKKVLIETSGSIDISEIPKEVHIVMDVKCPASNMSKHNKIENIQHLKKTDDVKFVIANKDDYEWAIQFCLEHQLAEKANVLFSPAWGLQKPEQLVDWIIDAPFSIRLNLQIHKYIWSPRKKGV